ncbi:MAG: hypothetical protein NTU57_04905 [Candidatus Aenigmarchaeota archaeon]|nr:hypothetical protein [Candidatus Aenigmarchaeota archaeon]
MAKITNNMIAVLLVAAIALSGFSLMAVSNWRGVSITGGASTGTGTANVTIGSSTDIVLLRSVVDFDSGSLGGATRYLTTNSDNYDTFDDGGEGNGTTGTTVVYGTCVGTEATCAFPVVVQNAGNINVSVNITASAVATSWIGTGAAATFKGKNNESSACGQNFGAIGEGSWTTLGTSETLVCNNLSFSDAGSDEIRIHFNLTVPTDATGYKTVTLTVGSIAA